MKRLCGFSETKCVWMSVHTSVPACLNNNCMNSMNVSVCSHNQEYMRWDCNVVSEPHCSHAQPRGVGHEGEAVPHRGGDQDVGHRLLCHTEAVSGRNPKVWFSMIVTNVFLPVNFSEAFWYSVVTCMQWWCSIKYIQDHFRDISDKSLIYLVMIVYVYLQK